MCGLDVPKDCRTNIDETVEVFNWSHPILETQWHSVNLRSQPGPYELPALVAPKNCNPWCVLTLKRFQRGWGQGSTIEQRPNGHIPHHTACLNKNLANCYFWVPGAVHKYLPQVTQQLGENSGFRNLKSSRVPIWDSFGTNAPC